MEPVKGSVVIFDEIDQMISNNSFYLNEGGYIVEACYLPSLLTQWSIILGFSGTMGQATSQQLRFSFPQCKSIGVPSLRKYGNTNKLVHVQKVSESGLVAAVISRMKELNNQFNNFIVLCKDLDMLKKVKSVLSSENNQHLLKNRKIVI